mgnify:CR=1 FL=1
MSEKTIQFYPEIKTADRNTTTFRRNHLFAHESRAVSKFAASIAHEVNNPLAGVLIYTRLLYKKISSEGISRGLALDYLSRIDDELTRIASIIKDLRDFSKQSESTFQELDINQVIEKALDSILNQTALPQIRVYRHLDNSLPRVRGDFDQLLRATGNLILNAIQAMPRGGDLTLRTYESGGKIYLEIKDTGCGIPPENLPKLFTPFFSTKPEVKGVGLGLAVALGIVRRHGGNIEVQSQVGLGSTFTVILPVQRKECRNQQNGIRNRAGESCLSGAGKTKKSS